MVPCAIHQGIYYLGNVEKCTLVLKTSVFNQVSKSTRAQQHKVSVTNKINTAHDITICLMSLEVLTLDRLTVRRRGPWQGTESASNFSCIHTHLGNTISDCDADTNFFRHR